MKLRSLHSYGLNTYDIYSYDLYSYGLNTYDLYSYDLYSYGLNTYDLYSYDLYSYGLYGYGLYCYCREHQSYDAKSDNRSWKLGKHMHAKAPHLLHRCH